MWISLLDGHPEKAISAAETGVRYLAEHSEFSVLPGGFFGGAGVTKVQREADVSQSRDRP